MKRLYNRLSFQQKKAYWAWIFLAVPIFFFVAVRFYPTFNAAGISLTKWNLLAEPVWVGLENYQRILTDKVFWKVFVNTFVYLIAGLPISLILAFAIAYYLDRVRFMHGFIRGLYFVPYLTTAVAMAWVWRWGYQPAPIGALNAILQSMGLPQQPFLRSPNQAIYAILAPAIWAGLGFQVIIFLAGLRAIPETYYEAARIDGIGKFATLWEITLPLLRPTILFLVVLTSIGLLRIFDQVYNMTVDGQGGPLNSTKPLVLNIYNTAFKDFEMGYATAQTMVLFVVLLIITLIQLRLMRTK